jgi:hypothetical protein
MRPGEQRPPPFNAERSHSQAAVERLVNGPAPRFFSVNERSVVRLQNAARLGRITRARMTQITKLLQLAPERGFLAAAAARRGHWNKPARGCLTWFTCFSRFYTLNSPGHAPLRVFKFQNRGPLLPSRSDTLRRSETATLPVNARQRLAIASQYLGSIEAG